MFRTILVVPMLIGALTFSGGAAYASEPDLAGVYLATGNNPDGSPYQGIVEIVEQNSAFLLVWRAESEVVAVGIGIRSGNVLAVSYFAEPPGVVAYRIEEGNRLVGAWTVIGADGALFSETLTKVPAADLEFPVTPSRSQAPQARLRHR